MPLRRFGVPDHRYNAGRQHEAFEFNHHRYLDAPKFGAGSCQSVPIGNGASSVSGHGDVRSWRGGSSWRDLMAAAVVVRSMLGVNPSAYEEACQVSGPENAATVMACILERGGHINSVGGYLRSLTDKARLGQFSIGPMLMALLRQCSDSRRLSG